MQVQENDFGGQEVKRIFLWRGGGAGYKDRPGQAAKRLRKEVTFRIGLEEGRVLAAAEKAAGGFRERLEWGGRRAAKWGLDIEGQSPPDCGVRAWLSILEASELPLHHRFLAHPWVSGSGTQRHLPLDPSLGPSLAPRVEKEVTEDKMVGWHHRLNGHEQTPGDSEGQGSLACCSPWGRKESDMTEWLNSNNKISSSGIISQ